MEGGRAGRSAGAALPSGAGTVPFVPGVSTAARARRQTHVASRCLPRPPPTFAAPGQLQWCVPFPFLFVCASGTSNLWHKIPYGIDYTRPQAAKLPATVLDLRKNLSHNVGHTPHASTTQPIEWLLKPSGTRARLFDGTRKRDMKNSSSRTHRRERATGGSKGMAVSVCSFGTGTIAPFC